jgi:hypothetical protein
MDFVVDGRQEIEAGIPVRTAYVVISITDPGSSPARLQRPAGFRDVLRLQFHDAVPVKGFALSPNIVLMNEDHAKGDERDPTDGDDKQGGGEKDASGKM